VKYLRSCVRVVRYWKEFLVFIGSKVLWVRSFDTPDSDDAALNGAGNRIIVSGGIRIYGAEMPMSIVGAVHK
jgi:hypothetical protein